MAGVWGFGLFWGWGWGLFLDKSEYIRLIKPHFFGAIY